MTLDDMEAVVSEWLSRAHDAATDHRGIMRYVPVCQTEIDAIRALLLDYQENARQLAEAIYRQVVPLLAECSEPNPEDYINAILAALGTKGADHD